MKNLSLDELIADLDRQIAALAGKREMLARLREIGAVISVPDAPPDAPPDAQGETQKEPAAQ